MSSEPIPSAVTVKPKIEKIIKKVPGKIPPLPKEKDVYLDNLSKKTVADLKELLERQERILSNKSLLSKLPDKGNRTLELKMKIEKELKSRDEISHASDLMAQMSLSHLNALEWTGHCSPGNQKPQLFLPQDDDIEEIDPLKIIASHCGTTGCQKQISILQPQDRLVKPDDLVDFVQGNTDLTPGTTSDQLKQSLSEIKTKETLSEKKIVASSSGGHSSASVSNILMLDEPERFAHIICERYGHRDTIDRFKPNKPLKPFTGTFPLKPPGRVSAKHKQWEETNVTPPPPVHGDAKLLSLEESLQIQREQNRKLKEIQLKHAAERLTALHGVHNLTEFPVSDTSKMLYRGSAKYASDSEDDSNDGDVNLEEQELHDEDQQDRSASVVYSIES